MSLVTRSRLVAVCITAVLTLELIQSPALLSSQSAAEADPLVFVTAVETGGKPDALVVDACPGRNEVIFYDRNSANVRFLDGASLTLLPETLNLPSWNNKKWILFDRGLCLAYVATTRARYNFGTIYWEETRLHILDNREVIATVSVNESYNNGLASPPDTKYYIEGLVLKQSGAEAGNPARLILDNTNKGRIDAVDLSAAGIAIARNQRFAYDERSLTISQMNFGNSLALEDKHETLAIDDMVGIDHLYIADRNHASSGSGRGYVRLVRIAHPMQDLNPVLLPEVNLNGIIHFFQGPQGIAVAGPRDRLYIASASVSWNTGRVAQVQTTNPATIQNIDLTYEDSGEVLVDWYDPQRVFVATSDYYNNLTPGLYLHLIYDSTVVDTLQVLANYDHTNKPLKKMAFDPTTRRLYMGVGSQILVIQVNYGAGSPPGPIDNPVYLPLIRK
jgi:hypothetical protein